MILCSVKRVSTCCLLNGLRVVHECDRRTDRQTDRTAVRNSAVYNDPRQKWQNGSKHTSIIFTICAKALKHPRSRRL